MINRVLALFDKARPDAAAKGGHHAVDELHLAAAALLVTAASADAHFDAAERAKIGELLGDRLDLTPEEVETLLAAAVAESERASQLLGFTRAIKDGYPYEERVALIEMLWEVVYADGVADEFEMQLLRRIGGLVYVTDRDRGLARQRVLARLGRGGAG